MQYPDEVKILDLPGEWWEAEPGRTDPDALSIRFNTECHAVIGKTAKHYGISRARVVRMLIRSKLREMGAL